MVVTLTKKSQWYTTDRLPLKLFQYHSVPLDHSVIFQQDSVVMVLSTVILNTIHAIPLNGTKISLNTFRYHSNTLGHDHDHDTPQDHSSTIQCNLNTLNDIYCKSIPASDCDSPAGQFQLVIKLFKPILKYVITHITILL